MVQPSHLLSSCWGAHPYVVDNALVKRLVCPIEVFVLSVLSSDHCPSWFTRSPTPLQRTCGKLSTRIASGQHFAGRYPRILNSARKIHDEALARFDEAVAASIGACTRIKPNLMPDNYWILEEIHILTLQKNKLLRRWQWTRYIADKSALNRTAGELRRDMQAFQQCC